VAHDLRAPLRAIGGFTRLLEEHLRGGLDGEGSALIERIHAGTLRMGKLIESLLEFARSTRAEMKLEDVDLRAIADSVAQDIALQYPKAKISVGALPRVHGDATLLREVLENLVGNACKYSSKVPQPRIEIDSAALAQGVACFVRDNGAGFDAHNATHLFAAFHRQHHEAEFPGNGIGLALCKRIVERHGGRIWAEAAPEEGATFYFTLGPAAA
jgi:light-regulated signal transduction histidine kinase (bacteriophytochrome)